MAKYGTYIRLISVDDPDERLEKLIKAFPGLVHQVQATNQAMGLRLDLDTLKFYVHADAGLGLAFGWECDEKEGDKS